MIRRRIKLIISLFALALLFTGCAGSVPKSDIAGKAYTYENEGIGGDFTITINGDGTFSYCEGIASSYLGFGSWTLEGETLFLSDDEQMGYPLINCFKVDGNDLVFQAEGSTNFLYVKVADGERFSASQL